MAHYCWTVVDLSSLKKALLTSSVWCFPLSIVTAYIYNTTIVRIVYAEILSTIASSSFLALRYIFFHSLFHSSVFWPRTGNISVEIIGYLRWINRSESSASPRGCTHAQKATWHWATRWRLQDTRYPTGNGGLSMSAFAEPSSNVEEDAWINRVTLDGGIG